MPSLSYLLKLAKSEGRDFFETSDIHVARVKNESVINPYPQSLFDRRLWALVGTFTDYMIRKMFRDRVITKKARIIPENDLIAELAVPLLDSQFGRDTIESKNREEFLEQAEQSIEDHRKLPWEKCIPQSFLMSQLDSLQRHLILYPIKKLTSNEIDGLTDYLAKIQDWLKKIFSETKRIILNPVYGHRDLCMADADIAIDNTLYDIKTTTRPEELRKSKNQVLAYIALEWHHEKHPIAKSPPLVELKHGGFLLPLSLRSVTFSLHDFADSRREEFCSKLLELRNISLKKTSDTTI